MDEGAPDELTLLKRMAARDELALGLFYDRFANPLFSLAMRVLRNEREAEEAVQDAFLAAWRQAGTFDGSRGSVFTWLVGITRNKCIDRLRKSERRLPAAHTPLDGTMEAETVCPDPDPATSARQREVSSQVRQIVRELPEPQRRALELAFFEGLTHSEIADQLSEAVGTIKSRIRLAMEKLRTRLQGETF